MTRAKNRHSRPVIGRAIARHFSLASAALPPHAALAPFLLLFFLTASACTPNRPEFPLGDPRGLSPLDPVVVATLFPLAPRSGAYVVTDGTEKGKTIANQLAPAGGLWRLHFEGRQDTFFTTGPDGALDINREDDAPNAVSVEYAPPLVCPATLEIGTPFKDTAHMIVRRQSNGTIREQGVCRYSVELLGTQYLTTPAGRFDAIVVRTTRKIRLRLASVDVLILDAYDPDGGAEVAQRVEQAVWPLGLVPIHQHEELRLAR